ncbi:MAG: DNA-binding response regulator [Deltaproteobacteria bacterium]|nr:MAG: DNA-binding response regulator [Deltaproteobacteria bacterium]
MPPYRLLLAEDHVIFREAIKQSLQEIPGLEVVGEVSDGSELNAAVEKLAPQMVVLDIGLPQVSGLEAAQDLKRHHPEIKILILTMYKTREHLSRALKVGVDGYLLKENAFNDLITAINTIRAGRIYISSLVSQLVQESFLMKSWNTPEGDAPLSPREKDVLKYLAEGKSNNEIAELLIISGSTVRIHLANIKKKLSIKTNVELARYALKQGYTTLT